MAAKKLYEDLYKEEPLGDSFFELPSEEEKLLFLLKKQNDVILKIKDSIKSKLNISEFLDFESDQDYINMLYKAVYALIEEKHDTIIEYCSDVIRHDELKPLQEQINSKFVEITNILFRSKTENYDLGILFRAFLDLSGYYKSSEKLLRKIIE